MKKIEAGNTLKEICPKCGKRIAPNRRPGSLTSYLFGAFDCACGAASDGAVATAQPYTDSAQHDAESNFCPKCGLRIAADSEDGSLTGFLFQDTRCKCPPDQAFADGKMSERFWKMKAAGAGTTFIRSSGDAADSERNSIGLAAGATIGGAYEIIQLIGRGGMGEVYLARHKTLGKECALKVIPPEQVTEITWQRFQLEARTVAKLDHKNLVRVTDLGIHEGCLPYYAMDYVGGSNLEELVAEYGPMPLATALDLFMQVCEGVDCAHRSGILHRDLKPANIMVLSSKSGNKLAKVLDFGLAKLTAHDRSRQSLTAVGFIFGSPLYMSPEQCTGAKLDRRSDVYSLGCTIFQCLTGRPPFPGNAPEEILRSHTKKEAPSLESVVGKGKFPTSMEIVVAKLLRKNPVERYQTLLELRGDLKKVARGEDVSPFYMSRSKQWKGDAANESTAAQIAMPEPASQKPFPIGRVIAVTTVFAAVVGILSMSLFVVYRPAVKHEPAATISLEGNGDFTREYMKPVYSKDGLASLKDTTPFSKIVEENGQQFRVFNLPLDTTIGYFTKSKSAGQEPASGNFRCPVTEQLRFTPYPCAVKHPGYLKRFRPGDVDEILLSTGRNLGDLVQDFASEVTSEAHKYDMNDYLEASSAVPAVQKIQLTISRSSTVVVDLSLLDKFPSLKQLSIQGSGLDTDRLSKVKCLKQLKRLDLGFNDGNDVTAILKSLKGSTRMSELVLQDSTSSLAGIACAASLPELRYLSMGKVIPSNQASTVQALRLLSKAPKLQALSIQTLPTGAEAIATFKSFKALKILRFDRPKSVLAPEVRILLSKTLPGVTLTNETIDPPEN